MNTWIVIEKCAAQTCVDEVCGIADHRSIDSQALVMSSSGRARLLLNAAGEQLNHDVPSAGHLFAAGALE